MRDDGPPAVGHGPTGSSAEPEIGLPGGMGSGGAVVRIGSTVRRPVRPHSASVAAFLDHLARVGFTAAPRVLGTDEAGREVLSFLEGDVGVPPFPAWVADDELLVSVAELQRTMHDAARSFEVPADAVWDPANVPEPGPGAIVCHNDLCIENVVVRAGRATGFIDFDFAAPADPRFDIAVAARHWVPIRHPSDLSPAHAEVDQIARFRRFCDAHSLGDADRHAVVRLLGDFLDRALVSMRERAEFGNDLYRVAWEAGYPHQNRRARDFVDRHATALTARR